MSSVNEIKEMIKEIINGPKPDFGKSDGGESTTTFAPVAFEFGCINEQQKAFLAPPENPISHSFKGKRSPIKIMWFWRDMPEIAQSDIGSWILAWDELHREGILTKKPLSVISAHIEIGYKDKVYDLYPIALGMDDGLVEAYAPEILESLRRVGVNYGYYVGYLD